MKSIDAQQKFIDKYTGGLDAILYQNYLNQALGSTLRVYIRSKLVVRFKLLAPTTSSERVAYNKHPDYQ